MAASLKSIPCQNCGAPIEIKARGISVTFVCHSCGSVIDATRDGYEVLQQAVVREDILDKLIVPLGSRGKLFDVEWEVIGFVSRRDVKWGFSWDEYLLFNPYHGFRFLIHSELHFSFAQLLTKKPSGSPEGKVLGISSSTYDIFHRGISQVTAVAGEFYWRVRLNERCEHADFVSPPEGITVEVPEGSDDVERTFTLSRYISVDEVEKAFGISGLLRPVTISPIQPNPHLRSAPAVWFAAITCCIGILLAQSYFVSASQELNVFRGVRSFSRVEAGVEQLLGEFEIEGRPRNVEIRSYSPVSNSWVEVDYEIEREDGSESGWASQAIEYYFGRSDGESWSEGSTFSTSVIGALSPGKYKVFATVEADSFARDMATSVETRIRVDVPIWSNLFIALFALLVYPCLLLALARSFERRQWQDSDYSPYSYE
jgi:hypothetical protein